MNIKAISKLVRKHRPDLAHYEESYKYFHLYPELSNQEFSTADVIVIQLKRISDDFDIKSRIGGAGVAAILRNGPGLKILLRADMDALPVEERTGLLYASFQRATTPDGIQVPVMHACGHDMHMAGLVAAAELLVSARRSWSGTCIFVFQPAEERGTGARAMVDDGMYEPHARRLPR